MYYHINKEYISQKLCENRNNPAMHCNGHCFLSKQLKKAEERATKQSQSIKNQEEQVLVFDEKEMVAPVFNLQCIGLAKPYLQANSFSSAFGISLPPEQTV